LYKIQADSKKPGTFILAAGNAHGITDEAEFFVYATEDITQPYLGIITARNVGAFTTKFDFSVNNPLGDRTTGYALLKQVGKEASLRLSIAEDDRLAPVALKIRDAMNTDIADKYKRLIILTDEDEPADFRVSIEGNNAVFDILYEAWNKYGLKRLPSTVSFLRNFS
jgi:hypothetical protein